MLAIALPTAIAILKKMTTSVMASAASTRVLGSPARSAVAKPVAVLPRRAAAKLPQRLAAVPDSRSGEQSSTVQADAAKLALLTAVMSPMLLDASPADAANALVAGKTVSLIHPFTMIFLFGSSLYTGWLGLQWRTLRTLPGEIKQLKAQLPKPDAEGNKPSSPLDGEIAALEDKRKSLAGKDWKGIHHNWGGLLLGLGVLIAVVGPANTYIRLGKLFPGPHLYAGASIVVLWALAASLVPAMAKGNDNARTLHITANVINICLFAWQLPTGFDILTKVLANTPWP